MSEEVIQQLYAMILAKDFGYPVLRIEPEYAVLFGRKNVLTL